MNPLYKFTGHVEADETFIEARAASCTTDKRRRLGMQEGPHH
jgi:hypothetical protein